MTEPLETAELLAFTTTVDAKSLSRAAADLGVPRATIGRRLARLEERLGTRLLRRSTRSLALTPTGEAFYRHARMVLDAVQRAQASVQRNDSIVRGELRVALPPMADASFRNMLCEFASKYPEVRMYIHVSSQHVDLQRGGFDVAMRASPAFEPGLYVRNLRRTPLLAFAAPEYLAAHGTPKHVRDLRQHRCLLGFSKGEVPQTHWPLAGGGKVQVPGALWSNDMSVLMDSALRGLGIAMLPLLMCEPYARNGQLVHVLPGELEVDTQIALVFPERELQPPQVRAFVEWVVQWAEQGLPKASPECDEKLRARKRPSKSKR